MRKDHRNFRRRCFASRVIHIFAGDLDCVQVLCIMINRPKIPLWVVINSRSTKKMTEFSNEAPREDLELYTSHARSFLGSVHACQSLRSFW